MHTVTIEDIALFPQPNWIQFELKDFNYHRFLRGDFMPEEIRALMITAGTFLENIDFFRNANNVVLRIDEIDLCSILDNLDSLQSMVINCLIKPTAICSIDISLLPSLGIPITIDPTVTWDKNNLKNACEYFLYSSALQVPIEPFYSFMNFLSTRESLWTVQKEVLGYNFYINVENQITLSERWSNSKIYFGSINEDISKFEKSDLWQNISGMHEKHFAELSMCSTCKHYPFCCGYFKAINFDLDCETWRECFLEASQAFQEYNI
jgi:radical SAM protein with 4Fe4S-binding SPASM domain